MISKHEARSIIRKAVSRVPEGEEIRHLNIMPMMDMMTILLVAMIFQSAASGAMDIGDVDLPYSETNEAFPESAVTVTIAKEIILVQGVPVDGALITNGEIDASAKEGGALGIKIPRLSQMLGTFKKAYEQKRSEQGKLKEGDSATPELFIVADSSTPYRLLFGVIASARAPEAGYLRFHLIVLQKGETNGPPKK